MEIPTAYIEKFRPAARKSGAPRSEWDEQLDLFLSRLNPGRVADGFKPYTHARLAKLLSRSGVHDASAAYLLYQRCDHANSFSRLFGYLTKP